MDKNKKGLKIIFFRHGATPWNLENRAQGSSNHPVFNGLLEKSREDIALSAGFLKEYFKYESVDPKDIYIYTTPMYRTYDTSTIIKDVLNIPNGNLLIHPQLSGRNYGKIEGTQDVKSPKTIIKNPDRAIAYVRAQLGDRNNGCGIETKSDFAERVTGAINDIIVDHKRGDTIILSCNSDIWDLIRKNSNFENYFDFSVKYSVEPGDFVLFDVKESVLKEIEEKKNENENSEPML